MAESYPEVHGVDVVHHVSLVPIGLTTGGFIALVHAVTPLLGQVCVHGLDRSVLVLRSGRSRAHIPRPHQSMHLTIRIFQG